MLRKSIDHLDPSSQTAGPIVAPLTGVTTNDRLSTTGGSSTGALCFLQPRKEREGAPVGLVPDRPLGLDLGDSRFCHSVLPLAGSRCQL